MKVNIFGATGLIGGSLLEQCLEDNEISEVKIFVRQHIDNQHIKLRQIIATFDNINTVSSEITGDVVFNCLGTTLKKAGSEAAQYTIDCEYPVKIAQLAAANGVACMVNVSSVGASETGNFYLKTKADMENGVRNAIGEKAYFTRPSFLVGNRKEMRIGEKIGTYITLIINPLLLGEWRKYRAIAAKKVAAAMLSIAKKQPDDKIFHYGEMIAML
jgi:uncharacterized protein YbjT (DUF2867 family)